MTRLSQLAGILSAAMMLSLVPLIPLVAREPDSLATALARPVLTQNDFEYLGAFSLPDTMFKHSVAYAETGWALRHFNGKLRFITGSHRYSQDALFEVEFPGFGQENGKWPKAKVVAEYGTAPYGENRKIKQGKESGLTDGLMYDERTNRLYYSFGSWYNIPPTNDQALGFAVLEDDKIAQVCGAWKSPDGSSAHNQKIRGGSLIIPDWFASSFLDGRRIGIGFGGYYSGVAACSKGPFLAAAREPDTNPAGGTLDLITLIDHPEKHWGLRDPDYKSEIDWAPNPRGNVGFWGAMDEVYGAAVWIDLPDKHGLLMVSKMGHGRVWYEQSDRHCERTEAWWWMYDPRDLAAVALHRQNPWDPMPKSWKMDYKPRQHSIRTSGLAFDRASRTLFVLAPFSYPDGPEFRPLVHGYRVKK